MNFGVHQQVLLQAGSPPLLTSAGGALGGPRSGGRSSQPCFHLGHQVLPMSKSGWSQRCSAAPAWEGL